MHVVGIMHDWITSLVHNFDAWHAWNAWMILACGPFGISFLAGRAGSGVVPGAFFTFGGGGAGGHHAWGTVVGLGGGGTILLAAGRFGTTFGVGGTNLWGGGGHGQYLPVGRVTGRKAGITPGFLGGKFGAWLNLWAPQAQVAQAQVALAQQFLPHQQTHQPHQQQQLLSQHRLAHQLQQHYDVGLLDQVSKAWRVLSPVSFHFDAFFSVVTRWTQICPLVQDFT